MKRPNILITGTPGTGKTRLCNELSKKINFEHLDISSIAKENNFVEEYDDDYECPVLDEDKLLDFLEPIMEKGGKIIDYHSCEFFPERWFDIVYVLQCENAILFDRLTARGYNDKKIKSNVECEIFQTILEEAMDSYSDDIVVAIRGDSEVDLQNNLTKISDWIDVGRCRINESGDFLHLFEQIFNKIHQNQRLHMVLFGDVECSRASICKRFMSKKLRIISLRGFREDPLRIGIRYRY